MDLNYQHILHSLQKLCFRQVFLTFKLKLQINICKTNCEIIFLIMKLFLKYYSLKVDFFFFILYFSIKY